MGLTWNRPGRVTHSHKALWIPPRRCMECGHRIGDNDYRPIETRRYPVWWWPFELANRLQARLIRHLPRQLQTGYERKDYSNDGELHG